MIEHAIGLKAQQGQYNDNGVWRTMYSIDETDDWGEWDDSDWTHENHFAEHDIPYPYTDCGGYTLYARWCDEEDCLQYMATQMVEEIEEEE